MAQEGLQGGKGDTHAVGQPQHSHDPGIPHEPWAMLPLLEGDVRAGRRAGTSPEGPGEGEGPIMAAFAVPHPRTSLAAPRVTKRRVSPERSRPPAAGASVT